MSNTYPTPTKQELIARMDDGLAQFLTFIDQYSEEQLLNLKDEVGWNVRDHITHLAAWAEGIAALLRHEDRWTAMGLVGGSVSVEEAGYDAMNEQIVIQHRQLAPAEARAQLVQAHKRVVAAIEPMPEAALMLPTDNFVAPFSGTGGRPVFGLIAGNTFGHYKQHTPWIEAIVQPPSHH